MSRPHRRVRNAMALFILFCVVLVIITLLTRTREALIGLTPDRAAGRR